LGPRCPVQAIGAAPEIIPFFLGVTFQRQTLYTFHMSSHFPHTKSAAASRRSFLKTGAALGAAAALPSFTMRAADEQKK